MMLIPGHLWPSVATAAEHKGNCTYSRAVITPALELAAEWEAQAAVVNQILGKHPRLPNRRADTCRSVYIFPQHSRAAGRRTWVRLVVENHPLSWLYKGADLPAFFDDSDAPISG